MWGNTREEALQHILVLRTAITSPVWRGGTCCFCRCYCSQNPCVISEKEHLAPRNTSTWKMVMEERDAFWQGDGTMERHQPTRRTRRNFLWTSLTLPVVLRLASGDRPEAIAQTQTLLPTPSCAEKDDATPSQMEGPYYKRNSPQRTSLLEPGITGTTIVITGFCPGAGLSADCTRPGGLLAGGCPGGV